jgi:hypothetical protein
MMTSESSKSSDKTKPFETSTFAQFAKAPANVFQVAPATPDSAQLPGKGAFVNLSFGHVFLLDALSDKLRNGFSFLPAESRQGSRHFFI